MQRKVNTYHSQIIPKNYRGRQSFHTHFPGPASPQNQNQTKNHKKGKLKVNITINIGAKFLNKIWAYQTQQYIKRTIHQSSRIYPRDVDDSISKNQSMWYHINKLKNKNHKLTSINTEKLLTKVRTHLWFKTLNNKVGYRGNII